MKTENGNIEEKLLHPMNGGVMLIVDLILLAALDFCLPLVFASRYMAISV